MMGNDVSSAAATAAGHVERILARYQLSRADVLRVVVFIGDRSLVRALYDYVRGVGPAAIAAGRVGVRTAPVAAPGVAAAAA